jgi:segregation and condensation protein B
MEEQDQHVPGESPENQTVTPEATVDSETGQDTPEPAAAGGNSGTAEPVAEAEAPPSPEENPPAEPGSPAMETEPFAPEPREDLVEAALSDVEPPALSVDELMNSQPVTETEPAVQADSQLMAVLEALIYVAEEPLTVAQIAASLGEPQDRIRALLEKVIQRFEDPAHGVCIREIAGGFKMATKPEHHDAVRSFVKSLKPPLKLSLPALETLAVIAYKQPVTGPEILEIRGVQGGGVLKTLLDRKLIAAAGRKNVIGKPILYKTTKEFLIQFGLKDLSELPSLKEFEEIRRMAFDSDVPAPAPAQAAPPEAAAAPEPETEAAPPEVETEAAASGPEPPSEPGPAEEASQES